VRCSFPAGSKSRKTRRVEHNASYNSVVFETELHTSDERSDNTKQRKGNRKGITMTAMENRKSELCTDMMENVNWRLGQNRNGWSNANRVELLLPGCWRHRRRKEPCLIPPYLFIE